MNSSKVVSVLLLILFSCSDSEQDIRESSVDSEQRSLVNLKDFYFPIDVKGSHYRYNYLDKLSNETMSWDMVIRDTNGYLELQTIIIDKDNDTSEVFVERINSKGSKLVMLESVSKAKIELNKVLLWEAEIGDEFCWSATMVDDFDTVHVIKTRRFAKDGLQINNLGSIKPVILFEEVTDVRLNTDTEQLQFKTRSNAYFAKGIGLIELKNFSGDKLTSHFILHSIE